MSGRRGVTAALLAVLLGAMPTQAMEHWSGPPGSYDVNESARACFYATLPGAWTAAVTGAGAVTIEDPDPVLEISSRSGRAFVQNFVGEAAERRTSGDLEMCVGGVKGRAVSGWAVYTLVVHQLSGESYVVLQCTFSRSVPTCR